MCEVDYTVSGSYMQIKVPASALALKGYDYTINFAWTDNVHDEADQGAWGESGYVYTTFSGDIMDFYISGDVAPSGRFKYSYVSTAANAEGPSTSETVPTESDTEPTEDTATTEQIPETQPDAAQPSGCKSVLSIRVLALLLPTAALTILTKKKK